MDDISKIMVRKRSHSKWNKVDPIKVQELGL